MVRGRCGSIYIQLGVCTCDVAHMWSRSCWGVYMFWWTQENISSHRVYLAPYGRPPIFDRHRLLFPIPYTPLWQFCPPSHAGLLLTNSSKSCAVATPRTNLLFSSVMTANSSFQGPSVWPPRKNSSSCSRGVSMVMTLYRLFRRWKCAMADERGSSGLTLPLSSCAWRWGMEMYPRRARVSESTMVRWVYSRSKADRSASEMASEGFRDRAAGGSRSWTVAW